MIHIIPSAARHYSDFGWLQARWHFSFDTYHDPDNIHWGALRVFNDDVIQAGQGFPTHGHRDMEIVTIVLEGRLEHADSIGTREQLGPGEVQVMSAGSGIRHSEYNASPHEPLRLLQLWILPRHRGNAPRWEQRRFEEARGTLLPVVSSGAIPDTLAIDQDAAIYLARLDAGEQVTHHSGEGRKSYLFVMQGGVQVNGQTVANGDQARMDAEPDLRIEAAMASHLLLIDLPG